MAYIIYNTQNIIYNIDIYEYRTHIELLEQQGEDSDLIQISGCSEVGDWWLDCGRTSWPNKNVLYILCIIVKWVYV